MLTLNAPIVVSVCLSGPSCEVETYTNIGFQALAGSSSATSAATAPVSDISYFHLLFNQDTDHLTTTSLRRDLRIYYIPSVLSVILVDLQNDLLLTLCSGHLGQRRRQAQPGRHQRHVVWRLRRPEEFRICPCRLRRIDHHRGHSAQRRPLSLLQGKHCPGGKRALSTESLLF